MDVMLVCLSGKDFFPLPGAQGGYQEEWDKYISILCFWSYIRSARGFYLSLVIFLRSRPPLSSPVDSLHCDPNHG